MQLFVKLIPLQAGTAELAGKPVIRECPPDVEPDTIMSFLTQRLGDAIETIWTLSEQSEHVDIGWVFAAPDADLRDVFEFACVPLLQTSEGLQPVFQVQANLRREFAQMAAGRGLSHDLIPRPQRPYRPPDRDDPGVTAVGLGEPQRLDQVLSDIASSAHATLHAYPRRAPVARRIVLQDEHDESGDSYQDAVLDEGGTLTITGRDKGPRVSEIFGAGITCYEWAYVVPSDRVPALIRILADNGSGDVLALLDAHYQRAQGLISDVMGHPDIAAKFHNWHS